MEAIVLAGGFGTRLRQVVPDLPKPMAPIAGRPFLEILLASLAANGFRRVVLSLGYMANAVTAHFGDTYAGMELCCEIERKPLGTGGALRCALARCSEDHVFVFNGDTYLELEVAEVEAQWQRDRVPIIVAREVPDTARYGRLQTSGQRLTGFLSKGTAGPGLINAGCYVFPRGIAADFPSAEAFSLEADFLQQSVAHSRFDHFVCRGRFIDIGVPDDYSRAQTELAGA